MFMIYLKTKFHICGCSHSSVTGIKEKAKYRLHVYVRW